MDNRRLEKPIFLYVSMTMKDKIKAKADSRDQSISEYIRDLVRKDLEE